MPPVYSSHKNSSARAVAKPSPCYLHIILAEVRLAKALSLSLRRVCSFGFQLKVFSFPVVKWIGIRVGLPLPSTWEIAVKLGIYFVVEDYFNYWLHRALHSKWGYDKIHRVHHEFTAPVAYAAPYAHWSEILILGLPSFIGPAIVPCHLLTFCLWFVLRQIEAIETHCGYDFPHSPTKYIPFYGGAEYHDYHHHVGGQSHCNFASVFSYCDFIYGTNKSYRYWKSLLVKRRAEHEGKKNE